jgi:hypothetical protein
MTRKIEYAVGAAALFIRHLHRENFDRGLIATFGDTFAVEQSFTGTENYLHVALSRIPRKVDKNEGTRLYDSIEDVMSQFVRYGDRRRPWLVTVITDGIDNRSSKYRNNPSGLGRTIATGYNAEPSNFIFVIGVGEGHQIDKNALGTLGDAGGFLAMSIAAFPLLEAVFLQIAIRVVEQTVGRVFTSGQMTWGQIQQILQQVQIPFDYAFLIDRSGSMNEQG